MSSSGASTKVDTNSDKIEADKLDIELRKLSVEMLKLEIERAKLKWTALAGIAPIFAVIATIALGVWSLRNQSENNFQIEIAKSLMSSQNPGEVLSKSKFYIALFPGRVPENLVNSTIDLEKIGFNSRTENGGL